MERGLITRDWSLAYVQKVGSNNTPALYNITALWSALEGSILLWLLLLAIYSYDSLFSKPSTWARLRSQLDPVPGGQP